MNTQISDAPTIEELAGVIDSRGSISIKKMKTPTGNNRSPQHWLEITVRSVDKEFLEKIKTVLGGSITSHDNKSNKKTMFEWKIVSQKAKVLLESIKHKLGIQSQQAQLAIEFMGQQYYAGRQLLPAKVLEERDGFRLKMIALNQEKRKIKSELKKK